MTRFTATPTSVTSPLVDHRTARRRRTERRTSSSKQKRAPSIDTVKNLAETLESKVLFLDQIFLPEKSSKASKIDVEQKRCTMEKVLLSEKSVCTNFPCDVATSLACGAGIDNVRVLSPRKGRVLKCVESSRVPRERRNRKIAVGSVSNLKRNSFESDGDCIVKGGKSVNVVSTQAEERNSSTNSLVSTLTSSTKVEDPCLSETKRTKHLNNSDVSHELESEVLNGNGIPSADDYPSQSLHSEQTESDSAQTTDCEACVSTPIPEGSLCNTGDNFLIGKSASDSSSDSEKPLVHYEKSRLSTINIVSKKRCRRPPQSYSPSNHTQLKNCTVTKKKNLFQEICAAEKSSPVVESTELRVNSFVKEVGQNKHCEEEVSARLRQSLRHEIKDTPKSTSSSKPQSRASCEKRAKTKEKTQKIVYVLGVRQASSGQRQFLVQFENGTSNWLNDEPASEQLDSRTPALCNYFNCSKQDISVVHRLPVLWHCQGSTPFRSDTVQTTALASESVSTACHRHEGDESQTPAKVSGADHRLNGRRLDKTVVDTRNKELDIVRGDYVHITVRRADRRKKRINTHTCRELIEHLESCGLDDTTVVVISGFEDYFCSPKDHEKLLQPCNERSAYDEATDVLRYLVQTIKQFPKPILASVKHPGLGLAALMLSMFDMVFDENARTEVCSVKDTTRLPCLFPKLMGLTCKNECSLMGEEQRSYLANQLGIVTGTFKDRTFSSDLETTLEQMQGECDPPTPKRSGRKKNKNATSSSPKENKPHKTDCELELDSLQADIEHEKQLSKACLGELSTFWRDLLAEHS